MRRQHVPNCVEEVFKRAVVRGLLRAATSGTNLAEIADVVLDRAHGTSNERTAPKTRLRF